MATHDGGLCYAWIPDEKTSHQIFWCDEGPNGLGSNFCCGSCITPYYCCINVWARQNLNQCIDGGDVQMAETTDVPAPAYAVSRKMALLTSKWVLGFGSPGEMGGGCKEKRGLELHLLFVHLRQRY